MSLSRAVVAHDRERSVTYAAADIELAVRLERQIDLGMHDVAADIALVIRYRNGTAERSVTLEAKSEAVLLFLQHRSHQRSCREYSAESRRRCRLGMVIFDGTVYDIP